MARRPPIDDDRPLLWPLDQAGDRPLVTAARDVKKNYAERFSRALAVLFARALRQKFPEVRPTEDEVGHESEISGDTGKKRVDVAVWHPRDGLLLDVSIKTLSFPDWNKAKKVVGRFTKNVVRNDHELRAEADRLHRRQPYAVLVGVMFMPYEACEDGKKEPSSFAHAVRTFRDRTGRTGPEDLRFDRFEAFFVALYEYTGEKRGKTRFLDVTTNPPRQGRPREENVLKLSGVVARIKSLVAGRNSPMEEWADAEEPED